jgi:hypothetical protein
MTKSSAPEDKMITEAAKKIEKIIDKTVKQILYNSSTKAVLTF